MMVHQMVTKFDDMLNRFSQIAADGQKWWIKIELWRAEAW